jgi:hypothetical protein
MTLTLLKGKSKKKKLVESYTLLTLPDQDLEQWLKKTGLQVFTGYCGICDEVREVNIPAYMGSGYALICSPCPKCGDSGNQPFSYRLNDELGRLLFGPHTPEYKVKPKLRLAKIDEDK